jgi:hypothetical protein
VPERACFSLALRTFMASVASLAAKIWLTV